MSSAEFTVREAARADLDGVVALWSRLIDHHRELGDALDFAPDAAGEWCIWAKEHLRSEDSCVLVAESSGELVGMIVGMIRMRPPLFADRRYGFIGDIFVVPVMRDQGVGRELAEAALGWFRSRGLKRAELAVASVNSEAQGFWHHLGAGEHRRTMWMDL